MDISKNGSVSNTKYPGNLTVKGKVNTSEISVSNNLEVEGTIYANNILLNGKNINEALKDELTENITQTITNSVNEKFESLNTSSKKDAFYLGNESGDPSWRFRIVNGELLIEKLEEGEWFIKQSIE